MTLTRNSTHFNLVRQALRSPRTSKKMESGCQGRPGMQMLVKNGNLDGMKPMMLQPRWSDDASWEDAAYWADWTSPSSSWGDAWNYYEDYDNTATNEETYSQIWDRSGEETEEDKKTEEAYQLAVEANRTLAEAKAAVAKVRMGRNKDKGKSKFAGKKGAMMGPCFTCGRMGHSYTQCSDRHSKGSTASRRPTLPSTSQPTSWTMTPRTTSSGTSTCSPCRTAGQISKSSIINLNDRPSFKFGNGQFLSPRCT